MRQNGLPSQYLTIAADLARRIVRGDFAEGSRIYGRSILASEYNVSPETVRRALRLLADMKVVDILPQSGVVVLSKDSAQRYIANFEGDNQRSNMRAEMVQLIDQYDTLHQRIKELTSAFFSMERHVSTSQEALPNYEVSIPPNSPLIGKSIGTLNFWQATGGTIVAIRRGSSVLLSPGPYGELYANDVIILVGSPRAIEAAYHMVNNEGGST